jgi:hypothetical protein
LAGFAGRLKQDARAGQWCTIGKLDGSRNRVCRWGA